MLQGRCTSISQETQCVYFIHLSIFYLFSLLYMAKEEVELSYIPKEASLANLGSGVGRGI